MIKLLIEDYGYQFIAEVGMTGGYYDPSKIIWDERTHGTLVAPTLGGLERQDTCGNYSLIVNSIKKTIHDNVLQTINNDKAILEYKKNRRKEYPTYGDQLDAIYKKHLGDSVEYDAIAAKITAIKKKYPKS